MVSLIIAVHRNIQDKNARKTQSHSNAAKKMHERRDLIQMQQKNVSNLHLMLIQKTQDI